LRRAGHLPLIDKYLLHVQHANISAVNEAVNELCLVEEKHKQLRQSIDSFDAFDQIALAQLLEKHERLEFRRISSYIYKNNKRWEKAMDISKADSLWADAMETVAESKSQELAEDLLYFFVNKNEKECFAAALFTCYELIRPDVVLELSWRFGLTDFAMPYMIQSFRQFSEKISSSSTKLEELEKALKEAKQEIKNPDPNVHPSGLFPPIMTPLLTGPPGMMPFTPNPTIPPGAFGLPPTGATGGYF